MASWHDGRWRWLPLITGVLAIGYLTVGCLAVASSAARPKAQAAETSVIDEPRKATKTNRAIKTETTRAKSKSIEDPKRFARSSTLMRELSSELVSNDSSTRTRARHALKLLTEHLPESADDFPDPLTGTVRFPGRRGRGGGRGELPHALQWVLDEEAEEAEAAGVWVDDAPEGMAGPQQTTRDMTDVWGDVSGGSSPRWRRARFWEESAEEAELRRRRREVVVLHDGPGPVEIADLWLPRGIRTGPTTIAYSM
ncbi:hypothetical protein LTR66_008637 [Elasticomyces elasticus]|nr:hypothetical protein LTR66_008637 [Elasticomyces elasticus]